MTYEQQTMLWNQYNTFRLRKAMQYQPQVEKALKEQLQVYADTRNLDAIPMQGIADVVQAMYVDAGRLWAAQSYRNILYQTKKSVAQELQTKAGAPFGFNEDFINSILQYFQTYLLNDAVLPILETTKNYIRNALNKGFNEGLGLDDIVNLMLSNDITKTRAELIARTEVMKAANYGADLGAEKTGLLLRDVWLSVRDGRTRRDHMEADNQTVAHGQPFVIGVERFLMLRPGASKSEDGRDIPAKEVCNCRCVKAHEPVLNSNGLPIRV